MTFLNERTLDFLYRNSHSKDLLSRTNSTARQNSFKLSSAIAAVISSDEKHKLFKIFKALKTYQMILRMS